MGTALSSVMTLVTTCWSSITAWVPVLFGVAFVVIKFSMSGISRIAGFRKRRRGR